MTYFIKCLIGTHSKGDFLIKAGQELEASKEIYDFFNNAYGASGKFNFRSVGTPTKPVKKAKVVEEKPEVKEAKPEVKEEKPRGN